MTDTLVLNPEFGFEELREDELVAVDGGLDPWLAIQQLAAQAQKYAGVFGSFTVGAVGGIALTPAGSSSGVYLYNAAISGLVGTGCYYFGKI
jgi:hypothetical protein